MEWDTRSKATEQSSRESRADFLESRAVRRSLRTVTIAVLVEWLGLYAD